MIAIILAGGYGKRLWPMTQNIAKPLLPVAGKPVIDYLVEKLSPSMENFEKIIVLTNSRFKEQFEVWARRWLPMNIEVISDGSSHEDEKPGAVGALASIARMINDDFLVVAGDCIYEDELTGFLAFYNSKRLPLVAIYKAEDQSQIKRGSTVVLDRNNRITNFIEKPEEALTDLVGAVLYAFPQRIKNRVIEYVSLGLSRDEPGRFIEWLHKAEPVYGYILSGTVWDIGTPEAYRNAEKYIRS